MSSADHDPTLREGADAGVAAEMPQVGEKYVVQSEVGRGAMGRVLAVRDRDLNRDVAMKVMLPRGSAPELVKRFVEEAQITGQLEHPNVLPVHDFGANAHGELYFTMKYVKEHETLAQIIDKLRHDDPEYHARFSFERRVQMIQSICHALAYAHARGVIHRDVKPANIIIGNRGEVFLADWGVAKIAARDDATQLDTTQIQTSGDERTTNDGAVIGSLGYMSPEQLGGGNVDQRSDVYGITAVLYELLCLHHYLTPLDQRNHAGVRDRVAKGTLRPALYYRTRRNGRVPKMLSRICQKGLARDPSERFVSASELELALQRWLEGRGVIVCPGTAIQRVLCGAIRFIDAYPVAAPTLAITSAVLLLGLAVLGVMHFVS